ncbi:hypothetical protein DFQ28_001461 [Apophysomyces sp. BC1034]|nr:hypothetical protein DFQ30_001893 [Apophysomyces sp. BC1015]KAG0181218.1 hypothetical protein DFQ29_009008 [Apophysomyces sp. BC1021]KAG0190834.1 hypothetical protein DFQ28_001461 [Apophysomyces sp. BC1034]
MTINYANANVPLTSTFTQPIILSPADDHKRKRNESFSDAEEQSLDVNAAKVPREDLDTVPLFPQDEQGPDMGNRKPGRKQLPEEILDDDDDPKIKRKAQNRAAQRAFRERKERYVKELEIKIKCVQDNHLVATAQYLRENQHLRSIIYRLEQENLALKGFPVANQEWGCTPPTPPPSGPHSMALKPVHHPNILPATDSHKSSNRSSVQKPTTPVPILPLRENPSPDNRFRFSISTPASLRTQNNRPSPKPAPQSVEPVKLYPDHSHPATQTRRAQSKTGPVIEKSIMEDRTPTQASSSPSSPPTSVMDNYDFDELVFRVQRENDDTLRDFLMDSLLNTPGELNLLSPRSDTEKEDEANDETIPVQKEQQGHSIEQSPKLWHHVTQLDRITQFSVDQLLQLVKKSAKCGDVGCAPNEWEFDSVIQPFDQGHL